MGWHDCTIYTLQKQRFIDIHFLIQNYTKLLDRFQITVLTTVSLYTFILFFNYQQSVLIFVCTKNASLTSHLLLFTLYALLSQIVLMLFVQLKSNLRYLLIQFQLHSVFFTEIICRLHCVTSTHIRVDQTILWWTTVNFKNPEEHV